MLQLGSPEFDYGSWYTFPMQESKLLGTPLLSSRDLQPIIQQMREKYQLPELSPEDDPIELVYLDEEEIPLQEFLQEIQRAVELIPDLYAPETRNMVAQARKFAVKPLQAP